MVMSRKTCETNDIEIIVDNYGILWLNEKCINKGLDKKNCTNLQ